MYVCNEEITKVIRKLEDDAIFPYTSLRPTLAVIHTSDLDERASSYLKSLQSIGRHYGAIINDYIANTPIEVSQVINLLTADPNINGIIIISDYGNMNRVLYNLIPLRLDIDGLSSVSIGNLFGAVSPTAYWHAPCTAVACLKIMEELNDEPNFNGQKCLILGRSVRVGRPLAEILTQKNMTVTLAHSKSNEIASDPYNWNYIVSAIGKPKHWGKDNPLYIKSYGKNCIIDVGMNYDDDGKLCGDVDRDWLKEETSDSYNNTVITPVKDGVGKVTTTVLFAKLFENAAESFKNAAGDFKLPPQAQLVPQPQNTEQQNPPAVVTE